GGLAGFCYAIKFPGVFVVVAAALFPLALRRFRAAALVAAGAALVMLPWLARDLALTGNPVAPLMNATFPNPYFHVAREKELAGGLRSLGEVSLAGVPWELAFGDHLTGTFGPLLLALPLGLLALRRPAGRLCLAAAALLAAPWFFNTGARFLMPSVAFAALALGMALPRPAAWAAIVIQAALCWPHVIDTWETRFAFRLHEFPLRAAMRLTPEAEYIGAREQQYAVARMLEKLTPPNARILALDTVANAYLDREATVVWQSAEGDRMLDTLRAAAFDQRGDRCEWKVRWPATDLGALRLRLAAGGPGEWSIDDIRMFSGEDQVFSSPQWELWAWPNTWEVPLAFDGNLATRWRTWEPARAGMLIETDFDRPQRLSGVTLLSQAPPGAPIRVYGQEAGGRWRLLANGPDAVLSEPRDVRLDATRALRRAGFRWILTATGSHGNEPIGKVLAEQAPQWGMEAAGNAGRFILFHVK
ncbi:MAG: discoidin domain-containing protein, partial [Bryobacteraceae bacterium]